MPTSDVSIQYAGAAHGGSFHQVDQTLYVTSPYGASNALVGKLEGTLLAELLLFGLVQTWNRNHHVPEARSA